MRTRQLSMNRSAERRLGALEIKWELAETVLGAPIARFMVPMRVRAWTSKLSMNLKSKSENKEVRPHPGPLSQRNDAVESRLTTDGQPKLGLPMNADGNCW